MPNEPDDHTRQTNMPALGETDPDDQNSLRDGSGESTGASNGMYQDNLDTSDSKTDPITEEETDNPAELLQVPENEFKDELDEYGVDAMEYGNEDGREFLEDRDEDDDNAASNS